MDELTSTLGSVSWWVSVFLATLVLNLLSAYLKTPLDKILVKLSSRWSTRSENLRIAREARIWRIRDSERELQLILAEQICDRVRAAQATLLALLLVVLYVFAMVSFPSPEAVHSVPSISIALKIFYWGSLILLLIALRSMFSAMVKKGMVEEATSNPAPGQLGTRSGGNDSAT